jgi:hypothetical protein
MASIRRPPFPWDTRTCYLAASAGELKVLHWLWVQEPSCPWDEMACMVAIYRGDMAMLQWLRSQDPPVPGTNGHAIVPSKTYCGGYEIRTILVHGTKILVWWLLEKVIWRCFNGSVIKTLLVPGTNWLAMRSRTVETWRCHSGSEPRSLPVRGIEGFAWLLPGKTMRPS